MWLLLINDLQNLIQKNKQASSRLMNNQNEGRLGLAALILSENHGVDTEDIKRTDSREYLRWEHDILGSHRAHDNFNLSKTLDKTKNNPVIKSLRAERIAGNFHNLTRFL